jgi:hypothetical protein
MLVDYALTLIQSGIKVSIHINDSEILKGIKAGCSLLNIDLEYSEESNHLKGIWSSDFYPSQKSIKLGQQYLVLGQEIDKKSILHTLMAKGSNVYVPIQQLSRSIPFSLREAIVKEVGSLQSLIVRLIDYQWLFEHIDFENFSLQFMEEELTELQNAVSDIEKVIYNVKSLGLTDSELKRQNHKTGSPAVLEMFSAKIAYEEGITTLKVLRLSSDKNPLNAAQLMDHLDQQLIYARQLICVLEDKQVSDWLDAYSKCHPTSQELIRLLSIYNVDSPWNEVVQYYIATADTQAINYTASKLTHNDALFYLRSYVGNLDDKLLISSDMEIKYPQNDVVYILPLNTNHSTDCQVVNYQVAPSPIQYPRLDSIIVKQRLTDTELVHNARMLSTILADRLPQVSIFLNREHILISSRVLSSIEVLDWLHINEFEQLNSISMSDSLMECLVDQNRKTHIITYGHLLDTEVVSDWIFQTQIIETLQKLGLGTINVDLGYTNGNISIANLKDILNASLGG